MTAPVPLPPKTNTLALVGFVCVFVIPVAGLVLGILAIRQLRGGATGESGAGLARWAMIIGALGCASTLLFFMLWLSLLGQALDGAHLPV
ncbi:DUF4190 domain-containing protein [Microbacterium capsulatum]|uniref:DUF4190 domain-containing protein n=1 Tax=Microbacterium capsulatum TaxID=3041921 RepID=A0ABU0XFS4_9MICO|nr:DUF4190 domain-containing protein [Microbacterium sp. ASV81]MDQ4213971.1 DUF4190 domain-containing protein [Microbacterium sp. ASV81]